MAFTFWGFRWQHAMDGRLNIFFGSALLPWIVWSIERSLRADRHRGWWLLAAASIWALAFMIAQYYAFIGGLLVVVWLAFSPARTQHARRARLLRLAVVCSVFLMLSLPWPAEIDLPADLVRVGANDLVVYTDYANPPTSGDDPRQLSIGVTKLLVERAPLPRR